jgi:teichuronic acid biosynthesis glycosyltransferase TuaC
MNVLVLSHMFPSSLDANAGIFVLEQAKALREAGATVRIVSPTPWAPRRLALLPSVRKYSVIPVRSAVDDFIVERPRVPTLPKNVGFCWSGVLFYLSCRRLVTTLVRGQAIDVIHAHTILPDGFAAVLLGREFGVPVVCTAHGSDVNVYPHRNRFVRWASRWALRHADRVIAVSENLKNEALALAGSRDIAIAHNGADTQNFKACPKLEARSRLKLNPAEKLIGFVGYLRPEKGLEYLLEAFASMRRSDARLCIVGDGPLSDSLAAKARELSILDHCQFVGQRPHSEIPLWISAAECLALPSLSEGLPTILAEAMLCGVPVVATAVGGIPEVIRDGETGLLVACRDSCALARALTKLLCDEAFAFQMAARAQEFARSSLTWSGNAQAMLAIYNEAVCQFSGHTAAKRDRRKLQSISTH